MWTCTKHGAVEGVRCQMCADDTFEAALHSGDVNALAAECETRLRTLSSGGSLSFRCGPGLPYVWRMPLWSEPTPPPLAAWARRAAVALLVAWEHKKTT